MAVYSISYDLNRGTQKDYDDLYVAIKSLGDSRRIAESQWVTSTIIYNASDIYGKLKNYIDSKDILFISRITSNQSGQTFEWEWLKTLSY